MHSFELRFFMLLSPLLCRSTSALLSHPSLALCQSLKLLTEAEVFWK